MEKTLAFGSDDEMGLLSETLVILSMMGTRVINKLEN